MPEERHMPASEGRGSRRSPLDIRPEHHRRRRNDPGSVSARLARKHQELARTFVRCPPWAVQRLPMLARLALRLERGRTVNTSPPLR
jgi:hypothetical protein